MLFRSGAETVENLVKQVATERHYGTDLEVICRRLWKVKSLDNHCAYRFKLAQNQKQLYFLDNEAYWLQQSIECYRHDFIEYVTLDRGKLLISNYLSGTTLSDLIRSNGPLFSGYQGVIQSLIQAIEACHKSNCIHADIKPNNLLVVGENVYLMDFANAQKSGSRLAEKKYRGFSLNYSLPSLQQGSGALTEHNDWYAFFVILHIVMTGRLPLKNGFQSSHFLRMFEEKIVSAHFPVVIHNYLIDRLHDLSKHTRPITNKL